MSTGVFVDPDDGGLLRLVETASTEDLHVAVAAIGAHARLGGLLTCVLAGMYIERERADQAATESSAAPSEDGQLEGTRPAAYEPVLQARSRAAHWQSAQSAADVSYLVERTDPLSGWALLDVWEDHELASASYWRWRDRFGATDLRLSRRTDQPIVPAPQADQSDPDSALAP